MLHHGLVIEPKLFVFAAEIIGHLETQEGQDLGELVIVNRGRGRGRPRGKRRKIRFQCDICGRGFQHRGRFVIHKYVVAVCHIILIHIYIYPKMFCYYWACFCFRSYHKGVKFQCNTCNRRFTNKENFDLHQKATGHTGEGESQFSSKSLLSCCKYNLLVCYKCVSPKTRVWLMIGIFLMAG